MEREDFGYDLQLRKRAERDVQTSVEMTFPDTLLLKQAERQKHRYVINNRN